MENTQLHSTLPFAKSTWTDTDTQKHHFLAFGDTGPIQKTPIRTGESSLANASGPVVDLGLRAQQGSPRCRDSPPFSVPTGPSPPRTPRFNSPPTVSADAACTGHTVFARNAPWPKDVGHRPRPRLSKLFQVPRSRDVLCVVFHHPKPSRSSSGYPPDVTSMFRAGSELDPPCSGDLLT